MMINSETRSIYNVICDTKLTIEDCLSLVDYQCTSWGVFLMLRNSIKNASDLRNLKVLLTHSFAIEYNQWFSTILFVQQISQSFG